MTLRSDLKALIDDWPYNQAKAALRVADVVGGKSEDWWRPRGRDRVERELGQDGLSADKIDAVFLAVEGLSVTTEEVSLDRILADLVARESRP